MRLFVLLYLVLFFLQGCTSIQWVDVHGVTHHRGLVAVRQSKGGVGSRVDRYALGLDLSLGGVEVGVALGGRHTTLDIPQVVSVEHPAYLPELVAKYLGRKNIKSESREVSWKWFWVDEDLSAKVTYFEAQSFGLCAMSRDQRASMLVGYGTASEPVGMALDNNIVQIRSYPNGNVESWEFILWAIPSANSD